MHTHCWRYKDKTGPKHSYKCVVITFTRLQDPVRHLLRWPNDEMHGNKHGLMVGGTRRLWILDFGLAVERQRVKTSTTKNCKIQMSKYAMIINHVINWSWNMQNSTDGQTDNVNQTLEYSKLSMSWHWNNTPLNGFFPGVSNKQQQKKANKSSAFLVIISKICIMTVLTVWCGKFQIHNTNQNKKTKICRQIKWLAAERTQCYVSKWSYFGF